MQKNTTFPTTENLSAVPRAIPRFLNWILLGGLILSIQTSLSAGSTVSTLIKDGPLDADAHTTSLWRMNDTNGQIVIDQSGHERAGKMSPGVVIEDRPHALPKLRKAATFTGSKEDSLPHISSPIAGQPLKEGAFTVEIRLRFDDSGGYWLQAGGNPDLRWGMLLRGAGFMYISVAARTADDEIKRLELNNQTFLRAVGPIDFERFYLYALTFDGKRTFQVYVDGTLAWEDQLPEEVQGLALGNTELSVGRPIAWKSSFSGDIAEVRISDVARTFEPVERTIPATISEMTLDYLFDMGRVDSPVAEGYAPVTPETPYNSERGYGWGTQPLDAWDYWFAAGRYRSQPEEAEKNFQHGTLEWFTRDGLTLPNGPAFRADIPPGEYAVRVTVGHMREPTKTKAIIVNEQAIGEHLRFMEAGGTPEAIRTNTKRTIDPNSVTARGIVRVGEEGLRVSVEGIGDDPVHILRIEVSPWVDPIIQRGEGRTIYWAGSGGEPKGFDAAAQAFAAKNFREAAKNAELIENPLARATIWAWILGYANSTSAWHVELAERVIDTLRDYLAEKPNDIQAHSLLRAAQIFYPALRVQIDEGKGTNRLFGSNPWIWMRDGAQLALEMTPRDPFYGRAQLLGGSLLHQRVEQAGGLISPFEYRNPSQHITTPFPTLFFRSAAEVWPESALALIYAGGKVPLEKEIPIPDNAPEWATLQHRTIVRIMDTIHYWTDERQGPGGLMGGGLGDDVETLRWWSIGDLVTDDKRTRQGWRNLAETAWSSTGGHGYWHYDKISDVEHGSEPIGDTYTYLPFIDFGTDRFEETLKRQRVVLDNVLDVWTAKNPDGYRMFRSTHYSATEISPRRSGDHFYNVRAANPGLIYTWFTGDPEGEAFIVDWAESWRDAILAEQDGKPAGVWPIIVTFDDRSFVMDKGPWYEPGYYSFPAGKRLYNILLAAYELTGDQKFLDPQRKAMELLREYAQKNASFDAGAEGGGKIGSQYRAPSAAQVATDLEIGSTEWAVWAAHASFGEIGARYRLVSGDTSYDDVLADFAPPTTRFRIAYEQADTPAQREASLESVNEELRTVLDHLDYNWPLRTSEPKSTDRVWVGGTESIISMATGTSSLGGARGAERQWPLFGVSWKNTGEDVSILVTENQTDRLAGYLYGFDTESREIGARIWRLKPGTYTLRVGAIHAFGEEPAEWIEERVVNVDERGQIINFTLPPQQQLQFVIQ